MSSQFRPDGSYFRHFKGIPLTKLAEITEIAAWTLLYEGGYGRRPQSADLAGPVLTNKEYALATVQGDRAFIIDNHDGQYSLWCGAKDVILKALGREELPAKAAG